MPVYVFAQDNQNLAHIVGTFHRNNLQPLVDAKNCNLQWIKSNFAKTPVLFFFMDNEGVITEESLDYLDQVPSFAIYFNEYQPITETQMENISNYISYIFFDTNISLDTIKEIENLLSPTTITPHELSPEHIKPHLSSDYQFSRVPIPDRNVCLYQVDTPNCDIPYTVVVRDHANRGGTAN
jgi:hypothetical protein